MKSSKAYYKFSGEYFFQYFALGVFLPFLSIYFRGIGFSGVQIGSITAAGALMAIVGPPIFGVLSDRSHRHKQIVLMLMMGCVILFGLLPFLRTHLVVVGVFALFNMASVSLNPLMDTITLHSTIPFGKIRLWGSVGFAVAAYITGFIIERSSSRIIFPLYIGAILLAMTMVLMLKVEIQKKDLLHLKEIGQLLLNRRFLVFALYSLIVSGTIMAHNIYFGLMFKEVGGKESMIGLAFLLFALSEAPVMQATPYLIKRYGLWKLMMAAPIIAVIRWLLHGIIPNPAGQLAIFFLQGLSYGPYFIGSMEYLHRRTPLHLKTTAMTLNRSIGFGLGGMIVNGMSGFLYDYVGGQAIYIFYGGLCFLAILILIYLYKLDQKVDGACLKLTQ